MLDFMLELERLLRVWPDNTRWTLAQIAEKTKTDLPYVVEYLGEVLNKAIEVHDPVSYNEICKAFVLLQEKTRDAFLKREHHRKENLSKASEAFYKVMERIRVIQQTQNWRSAYRTLVYFYGVHKENLSSEIVINISDEALRLGIKSSINFQELCQWLSLGIKTLLSKKSGQSVEDALDFLDAYGDYFSTSSNRGSQLLSNILLTLKPSAMEFELVPQFNEVAENLYITSVMDVNF